MLGWRCLWCTTWFSTLFRALPPGPAVCATSPSFSVTGCLTYCYSGGVGWAATLPLYFCASPVPAGFAGVCWVLHPVSGSSRWGCVCSLGDSVMTLFAFPYLRVGALLAWGVYGVSCCEVCSLGCPSWLVLLFMSLFVLHLLLGWGGLVTGLWPRTAAPVCWALLRPWLRRSVAFSLWPHPLLMFSRLGFSFLGVC